MAITEAHLKWHYSTGTGTGNGFSVESTGMYSLGGTIATNEVPSGVIHVLFDVVSGDEASDGDNEYRCIFIHNTHATLTLQNPVVWIEEEEGGGANCSFGISASGAKASGVAAQAEVIADESTAPDGITFWNTTSKVTGSGLPNLGPGEVCGIWIKRTVPTSTSAMNDDYVTLRVEGDTAA